MLFPCSVVAPCRTRTILFATNKQHWISGRTRTTGTGDVVLLVAASIHSSTLFAPSTHESRFAICIRITVMLVSFT